MINKSTFAAFLFSGIFLITFCRKDQIGSYAQYPTDEGFLKVSAIHEGIPESSGIQLINGQLWTHNDSGDDPVLYKITQSNSGLIKEVGLKGADHIDFEDIAVDENFVYIGDFGNNGGNRQDLRIYKIVVTELQHDTANVEVIRFSYSDQTDFENESYQHNFDCEAMIAFNDSLYLFSKNHKNNQTKLYRMPNTPGMHHAELIDQFDTQGLITGAGMDNTDGTLCLLGYNIEEMPRTFKPFIWIFYDYPGNRFFHGKQKRVNLPVFTQTEGICFMTDGQFYISSEREEGTEAGLFLFDANKWKE